MFEASASIGPLVAVEAEREPARGRPARSRSLNALLELGSPRSRQRSAVASSPASRAKWARATVGRVDVALHLASAIGALGERPSAKRDRRPRSPSSPGWPGRGRSCALVLDEAVAVAVAVVARSSPAPGRRAAAARSTALVGRAPTGAARRAASRTAAWRRRCRSRRCRRRARSRGVAPKRISCRIRPGSSSVRGVDVVALEAGQGLQRARAARSGRAAAPSTTVSSESRPNRVMNHGAPAATTGRVGVLGVEDAQRAEVLDAAAEHRGQARVGRCATCGPRRRHLRSRLAGTARSTGWPRG